jgi:ClpP class serine protease
LSHELLRLTSKICNTPLLVTEAYLDKVMQVLEARNSGELAVITDKVAPKQRSLQYIKDKQLGIVDIHGGITDIPYQAMCEEEGVSHQSIREEVEQLIAAGAKTIVLDQDSNGGAAHMAFESANYIRDLADEKGVKLISYISGASFSASYVYTAVAHEVISNPSAEAGSIGVRVQLRNMNGYMRNLGIEDKYITAGEGKVPFNEDGSWDESFLADIKESVLEIYDQFTDHVTMWRGLDKQDIIKLGAKTFSSKKSLANGLIDKVMTLEEFKAYIDSGEAMNPITNLFKSKKGTEMSDATPSAELTVELETLRTELTNLKTEFETAQAASASLLDKNTSLEAQLEKALAELAVAAEEKKLAKADARKAQLSAVVGDIKAATLTESLANLSDEAFNATLSVLGVALESKEEGFTELGESGEEVEETLTRQEAIASGMGEFLTKEYTKKVK